MDFNKRVHTIMGALQSCQGGVIAIDGRAAAGKSSLAGELAKRLDAAVIHMDDFFLPGELRTAERLDTPGGNVHHERFAEEVLPFISDGRAFSYRIFDCSVMYFNAIRFVPSASWRIVEGAYSNHPIFGDYMDFRVFATTTPQEQLARLLKRHNPEAMRLFREKWIPLEEAYLKAFSIESKAGVIV